MKKTEFIYERWFLKILVLFCIIFPFIILVHSLFDGLTGIKYGDFWFNVIGTILAFVVINFYFKWTQHHKWFMGKGSYWVEDEIVSVKKGKKVYKLKNVKALMGTTISFLGLAKARMLKIDFGKKTITLVSSSTRPIQCFSDSELLPLFETVLKNNPELKKDDALDFYYETKKY